MENKREIKVRQGVEAVLEPGERLLAYTKGAIAGLMANIPVHVGLTGSRLIVLPLRFGKPSGQVHTIWRENIFQLKWSGVWGKMSIQLLEDTLGIAVNGGRWKKGAQEIVELHDQAPSPEEDPALAAQRRLAQVETFKQLGFHTSAEAVLAGMQAAGADETSQALLEEATEKRLALRVGAGFLFANVALLVLLNGLVALLGGPVNAAVLLPSIAIDIWIGVKLWQGRSHQWATWAVIRAVFGFLFFGITTLIEGYITDFVANAAFCLSIILALTGRGNRTKTLVAAGLYVVGYIGVTLASLVIGIVTAFGSV